MAFDRMLNLLCSAFVFAMLTLALAVPALADVTTTEAMPAADVTAASTTTDSQLATAPRKLLLLLQASNPTQVKGARVARRAVGVPALSWDDKVAAAAKQWADQLASSGCKMKHGGAKGLGQNLYWKRPAKLNSDDDRAAVRSWVAEKKDWTYSAVPKGCVGGKMCGHYTQVVWKGTQRVGCAAAKCADGGGMWVCDYSPQGNMVGSTPY
ncbi:unnamed protein product [Closterium sp. Naga37s-1]|nr:unnamed protein product [Closterium sp. Naga37s-1]